MLIVVIKTTKSNIIYRTLKIKNSCIRYSNISFNISIYNKTSIAQTIYIKSIKFNN